MDPFQQPGQGIGSNLLQGVGGIIDFGNGQATGATLLVELQPGAKIASFVSRFALARPGQDRDDCHHNTSTQEHDPSTPHPRIWARKWFEQNFFVAFRGDRIHWRSWSCLLYVGFNHILVSGRREIYEPLSSE